MTGRMPWRVFIGQWTDPEFAHIWDFKTWQEAHDFLFDNIDRRARTEDCPNCKDRSAEMCDELRTVKPEQEWDGEIEGDDHLLVKASRPLGEDYEPNA